MAHTGTALTLAYRGGPVTTCPNGLAALDKLRDRSDHFDLVLSDVYMPGAYPALARAAYLEALCRRSGLHARHVANASRAPQTWTASSSWSTLVWSWGCRS